MVQPSNWATIGGTLAVKAIATHMNATLQDAKAAGKRSAQGNGGKPTKQERKATKKARKRKRDRDAREGRAQDEEEGEEKNEGEEENEGEEGDEVEEVE